MPNKDSIRAIMKEIAKNRTENHPMTTEEIRKKLDWHLIKEQIKFQIKHKH